MFELPLDDNRNTDSTRRKVDRIRMCRIRDQRRSSPSAATVTAAACHAGVRISQALTTKLARRID
jgi:hypothetical protein